MHVQPETPQTAVCSRRSVTGHGFEGRLGLGLGLGLTCSLEKSTLMSRLVVVSDRLSVSEEESGATTGTTATTPDKLRR